MRMIIPACLLLFFAVSAMAQQNTLLPRDEKQAFVSHSFRSSALDHWFSFSARPGPSPGHLPGFRRMHCTNEELDRFAFREEACLAVKFGIAPGLSDQPEERPHSILAYQQPVFSASSLHKEQVTKDILKQLRREEWDFSGAVEGMLMRPPNFGGP